jgi:hypothetical protein
MGDRLPGCGSIVDSDVVSIRIQFFGNDVLRGIEQPKQISPFVLGRIKERQYVASRDHK